MRTLGTVGVLGGMGPLATVRFHELLVRACIERHGAKADTDFPEVLVASARVPGFDAYGTKDARVADAALTDAAGRLVAAGADFIAMPCNTMHARLPALEASAGVPMLDMVRETACAVRRAGARSAFVLATRTTMDEGLYQTALEAEGIRAIVPEPDAQQRVMDLITNLETANAGRVEWDALRALADEAVQAGADALVLGCTELSLIPLLGPLPCGVVDSSRVLANAAANRAYAPLAEEGPVRDVEERDN